jgi:CheY-like chemotaxis protein
MQGDEVLRRLRQDPRTQSIPVVMISADATPRQIERLMAAGATEYITKPLDVGKIIRLLDRTLARVHEGRQVPETVPAS